MSLWNLLWILLAVRYEPRGGQAPSPARALRWFGHDEARPSGSKGGLVLRALGAAGFGGASWTCFPVDGTDRDTQG